MNTKHYNRSTSGNLEAAHECLPAACVRASLTQEAKSVSSASLGATIHFNEQDCNCYIPASCCLVARTGTCWFWPAWTARWWLCAGLPHCMTHTRSQGAFAYNNAKVLIRQTLSSYYSSLGKTLKLTKWQTLVIQLNLWYSCKGIFYIPSVGICKISMLKFTELLTKYSWM